MTCFNRVQAAKGWEVLARGWLVPYGYKWPLACPCSQCLRDDATESVSSFTLTPWLVSAESDIESTSKSEYVFVIHAATLRCKKFHTDS